MAYARYGSDSDWYVFWESTKADSDAIAAGEPKPKSAEVLAIWHAHYRASAPAFTYAQVRQMMATGDFSSIPGFHEASRELLRTCMAEFIQDVDSEHDQVA